MPASIGICFGETCLDAVLLGRLVTHKTKLPHGYSGKLTRRRRGFDMNRRSVASKVGVKFWLEDAEGRAFFGRGMVDLLRAIDKYRSIALACERIGMSYRYALHRISIAEERSGRRLVDRFRGGRARGGARLTEQGRLLLQTYLNAQRVLDKLARSI